MKINHVCLVVKDMDKSISFYRDVLGLELVQDIEIPIDSGYRWHNPDDLDDSALTGLDKSNFLDKTLT